MSYYVRLLAPSHAVAAVSVVRQAVDAQRPDIAFEVHGDPTAWRRIDLTWPGNVALCSIERNGLNDHAELVAEEIDEFLDEIAEAQPASAVAWLQGFLPTVRTIYAFQIHGGSEREGGWDVIEAAKGAIWSAVGGIFQADSEGFSNEAGYHILWQFDEAVTGRWWMAVRERDEWKTFEMDLGNRAHRDAFKRGVVPDGVEVRTL